jgi:hypothetical protein
MRSLPCAFFKKCRSVSPLPVAQATAGDYAAHTGTCCKPPGSRYPDSGKEGGALLFACSLWNAKPFANRLLCGPKRFPVGLRMQPPNERFFPFSKGRLEHRRELRNSRGDVLRVRDRPIAGDVLSPFGDARPRAGFPAYRPGSLWLPTIRTQFAKGSLPVALGRGHVPD